LALKWARIKLRGRSLNRRNRLKDLSIPFWARKIRRKKMGKRETSKLVKRRRSGKLRRQRHTRKLPRKEEGWHSMESKIEFN